jgi:hypothetical protein
MDPRFATRLIGWERFPKHLHKTLEYDYSYIGVMAYFGLKSGYQP